MSASRDPRFRDRQPLRVGAVLATAVHGVRAAAAPFVLLTLTYVTWSLIRPQTTWLEDVPRDLSASAGWLIGSLVFLLVYSVLYIGMACVALDACRGKPVSWRRMLPSMTLMTEIGVAVLPVWFGMMIGFVLLIVPGIVVGLGWSQFYNSLIDERSRWFGSLTDSWRLTTGYKASMFLAYLCIVLPVLVLSLPLEAYVLGLYDMTSGMVPVPPQTASAAVARAVNTLVTGAFNTFFLFVVAAIYVLLRSYELDSVGDAAGDASGM